MTLQTTHAAQERHREASPSSSHILELPVRLGRSVVFVYGSNTQGRHGAGSAAFAAKHFGAEEMIGDGRAGMSYGIPTKDARLQTMPLKEIQFNIDSFVQYANAIDNQNTNFYVTRIGCGLAGYSDEQIAPLFERAPDNCLLAGRWEAILGTLKGARVIVAGSRSFRDYPLLSKKLDHFLSSLDQVTIVSGGADGADLLGEHYAQERGLACVRLPALWDIYGRAAGMIRNREMANYATHLVAFWDQKSPGTAGMLRIAKEERLPGRVVSYLEN